MAASFTTESWFDAAWTLVTKRHGEQTDPLGRPAPEHFRRVSERLLGIAPNATRAQLQAALLHDAFEPGGFSEEALLASGIEPAALGLIRAVTLPTDGRPYATYVDALCADGDVAALQVKLADNLDAIALYTTLGDPESLALVSARYLPARRAFESALGLARAFSEG